MNIHLILAKANEILEKNPSTIKFRVPEGTAKRAQFKDSNSGFDSIT